MSLIITETHLKLVAIKMGLIIPMHFETTTIEEIGKIAYSNIHCDNDLFVNWGQLVVAWEWLKVNPVEKWENELANDKFGYFKKNMDGNINVFRKHGLIR